MAVAPDSGSVISAIAKAFSLLSVATIGIASGSAEAGLTPNSLPLIVRNPYLSTWLPNARDKPWNNWPQFWTGGYIGMGAMIRTSDGTTYPLLGRMQDSLKPDSSIKITYPTYKGATYDSSTTNFTYSISPSSNQHLNLVLSFVSPITINDTLRQSIPAGYLNVVASGNIDFSIYVDVNGQWVSGNPGNLIQWSLGQSSTLKSWEVKRQQELLFSDARDTQGQAEWGSLYLSTIKSATHQGGKSGPTRRTFAKSGALNGTVDSNFRSILQDEPVFALSQPVQVSTTGSGTALFTIAHVQDLLVQFASAPNTVQQLPPLWSSSYSSHQDLLEFHYHDFSGVTTTASQFNTQINNAAYQVSSAQGSNFAQILMLAARQVLGGVAFAGTPDNTLIFLKEISSDGNMQTVDVIFPSYPFFLYANPTWLQQLLEPLLIHQAAGLYPNKYSMHDLGSSYPNGTGHPDGKDEYMPVEECGNMLIMGASVVRNFMDTYPGDVGRQKAAAWINGPGMNRYNLWKQWTGYLVEFSLLPANQLSTDDFAGTLANQTNLAIKGIIGIRAMGLMANVMGNTADEQNFTSIANSYISQWITLSHSNNQNHTNLAYNDASSWGTLYNLFGSNVLCFNNYASSSNNNTNAAFVPTQIYPQQSSWYATQLLTYGLPLDSRHTWIKNDWQLFAAAISSKSTRDAILQKMANWINVSTITVPLTDWQDGVDKTFRSGFRARPVVGGYFASLALMKSCGGKGAVGLEYAGDRSGVSIFK